MQNLWNPSQYQRFEKERQAPFEDLFSLINARSNMHVVDLGCGDGKLTKRLHRNLNALHTLGIDTSEEMLEEAVKDPVSGLDFCRESVQQFSPGSPIDLLFSHACIQWIPDHSGLFKRFWGWLQPGGQLALQMPANFDSATHTICRKLASEPHYHTFCANHPQPGVLNPEEYAQLLYDVGFRKQHVRLQVYAHELPTTAAAVEWVKGSLLTHYEALLGKTLYPEFLATYRQRILSHFGDHTPFFYPFKRILLWAQKS